MAGDDTRKVYALCKRNAETEFSDYYYFHSLQRFLFSCIYFNSCALNRRNVKRISSASRCEYNLFRIWINGDSFLFEYNYIYIYISNWKRETK